MIIFAFYSCKQNKRAEIITVSEINKIQNKTQKIIKKNCGCETDTLINDNTTKCDTVVFKNKSKLYYQFNCDSIWLTLENTKKKKKILYVEKEYFHDFYYIQYRLKYHLAKEYKNLLLFRSGCPANGPCNYVLIDKETGKLSRELGELIYEHNPDVIYDFVIYFSGDYRNIIVDFIDSKRKIKVPVKKENFLAAIPEYQFNKIEYRNGIITLTYEANNKITINTNKNEKIFSNPKQPAK